MYEALAKDIKKTLHHTLQPTIESTFGPDTYFVRIKKKDGKEYQIQGLNFNSISIIQVGVGPNRIGWQLKAVGLNVHTLKGAIADL